VDGQQPWPSRVIRIDFSSLADPKPYWVQFFDTGPSQGAWVGEGHVTPWLDGPSFADVRDARRKLAVRLAEADGAVPISMDAPQAPVKPLPASRAWQPGASAASAEYRPNKRLRRSSRAQGEELSEEVLREVNEMRAQIAAAQERQRQLEREIDEAMEQPSEE